MSTEDPRIQPIRRAFEEAHFDERTPEEKGFAEIFEKELKPRLIGNLAASLRGVDAQRRRRRFEIILMVASLPVAILALLGPVFFFFILPDPSTIGAKFPSIMRLMAFTALFIVVWVFLIIRFYLTWRVKDRDPNRELVIGRVLERFGCRAEEAGPGFLRPRASPIAPGSGWMPIGRRLLVGRFDGRIPFTALRVMAWRKNGKERVTTFQGWHMAVDLPFAFQGTTVVSARDGWHTLKPGLTLDTVSLEDPEFARRLVAKTDNQVEARVILAPDVIHHLASAAPKLDRGKGGLVLGFSASKAHVWIPSDATALSDWQPLHPPKLIQDIHEAFAEMAEIQGFLRDIDVIAESEGFRAQAARNGRAS